VEEGWFKAESLAVRRDRFYFLWPHWSRTGGSRRARQKKGSGNFADKLVGWATWRQAAAVSWRAVGRASPPVAVTKFLHSGFQNQLHDSEGPHLSFRAWPLSSSHTWEQLWRQTAKKTGEKIEYPERTQNVMKKRDEKAWWESVTEKSNSPAPACVDAQSAMRTMAWRRCYRGCLLRTAVQTMHPVDATTVCTPERCDVHTWQTFVPVAKKKENTSPFLYTFFPPKLLARQDAHGQRSTHNLPTRWVDSNRPVGSTATDPLGIRLLLFWGRPPASLPGLFPDSGTLYTGRCLSACSNPELKRFFVYTW